MNLKRSPQSWKKPQLKRRKLMSLQIEKMPQQVVNHGMFQLPVNFDQKKYAAHWIEEDQVEMVMQRQVMPQTRYTVDGLKVWKGPKGDQEPTTRVTGAKKRFTLMYRTATLQRKMNAIYGNVSKETINREVKGESVAGQKVVDSGIVTEQQL